ncbi:MAG: NUDIX hydrolase [Dehalococcoidia bacterium]|nr:NUDIX hydrolase [Dehalococcoidia bacterium]|tara:strand:+ start:557 stop:988 length:432 start_codon:yes stop_codon:yes gene_type:complete
MELNINIENNKYLDPKVVGIGILVIDNKILLVKRGIEPGYGKWSMPSGFINRFEKVEDAIERELFEECGIVVKANWISGVYSEKDSPIILLVWDLSLISGEPKPLDETIEVGFFDLDKLPELAFDHDDKIISDWQNQISLKDL